MAQLLDYSVADRVTLLKLALGNKGFIDAEIEVATKNCTINDLVDKAFPLKNIPSGDSKRIERFFIERERYREALYNLIIKPYEAFLNQN